ncbi:MAG: crosslink repair DNA glycosylase YcaQ family protein [Polyangiales bacterium]
MTAHRTLSLDEARRVWRSRQRLDGGSRDLAAVVSAVGWVPVPVVATPLLALRARGAITLRAELDAALFTQRTLELTPGPRGMLWLVPTEEAPWARAFAVADHATREGRLSAACGLTSGDLRGARDALRAALETPVEPGRLRERLPSSALRPLGEAGRRAGCDTLAGMVLRGMWAGGEVTREPVEPRVDRAPCRYLLDPRPRVVPAAAEAVDVVAPRWIAAHGPTTLKSFSLAFGIATGRAAQAVRGAKLERVHVEGLHGEFLAPAGFEVPAPGAEPTVDFLPFRDPLVDANPTLAGLCPSSLVKDLRLRDLGYRPLVLVDGAVVASWSYAPDDTVRVAWPLDHDVSLEPRVREAAASLARFIASEAPSPTLHTTALPRRIPALYGALGADL